MWFYIAPHPCVSSSIWTIHQATNGSISKFHLEVLHHHTLSSMLSNGKSQAHCVQILSCSGLEASVWFITQLIFSTFWLFSLIFFKTLRTWLGLPHPSIANILQCVCTDLIDLMGIHFLCYIHGKECIGTHDAIRDTFVTIARNANFHMGWKQLHVLPSTTFNSFRWWLNIMFTKDDIHTLADVVIVDPTQVNLFPQFCTTQGFATSSAAQTKEKSYQNWHPTNQLFPLTIDVFGYLHKHVDVFLHDHAMPFGAWKGNKASIFLLW